MSRQVKYEKQTFSNSNPAARYAHTTRFKRALGMVSSRLEEKGTLVDFGAGKGLFLHELMKLKPSASLWGIDPYKPSAYTTVRYAESLAQFEDCSVDIVTAFEVCEHLTANELEEFLNEAGRVLRESGFLILSVPIMHGPVVILKELNHMVLMRRKFQYSPLEFLRVVLGLPIERPKDPRHTHKGFDFRALRKAVHVHFKPVLLTYSPFSFLPWVANSQMFMIIQRA
jgi:SAM-dependent methyltransferase